MLSGYGLHEWGFISNPKTKAMSIVFTEEGMTLAKQKLAELFSRSGS
jgi:hypothetical protein